MEETKYINISNKGSQKVSAIKIKIGTLNQNGLNPDQIYVIGDQLSAGVRYNLSHPSTQIVVLKYIDKSRIDGYPIFSLIGVSTGCILGDLLKPNISNIYAGSMLTIDAVNISSNTPDAVILGSPVLVSSLDDHIKYEKRREFINLTQIGPVYNSLEECISASTLQDCFNANVDSVLELKLVKNKLISATVVYDYENEPEFERD